MGWVLVIPSGLQRLYEALIVVPSDSGLQLWKITIFNGKIHYKWPLSIATQYVCLPEGMTL